MSARAVWKRGGGKQEDAGWRLPAAELAWLAAAVLASLLLVAAITHAPALVAGFAGGVIALAGLGYALLRARSGDEGERFAEPAMR